MIFAFRGMKTISIMKKILMIAFMTVMSMGAFAQDGKFAVGANVGFAAYGNKYNPFGLGAKFQYEFVENFRAEVAYNYWFPKDKAGIMDFDLNFQYLIPIAGLQHYLCRQKSFTSLTFFVRH